jgi:hypothetical protein
VRWQSRGTPVCRAAFVSSWLPPQARGKCGRAIVILAGNAAGAARITTSTIAVRETLWGNWRGSRIDRHLQTRSGASGGENGRAGEAARTTIAEAERGEIGALGRRVYARPLVSAGQEGLRVREPLKRRQARLQFSVIMPQGHSTSYDGALISVTVHSPPGPSATQGGRHTQTFDGICRGQTSRVAPTKERSSS